MYKDIAFLLVGDHLGQLKKVLLPSNEIFVIPGCATPDRTNPIVSIEPIGGKQLVGKKQGQLYLFDPLSDELKELEASDDCLVKALPFSAKELVSVHGKYFRLSNKKDPFKNKKGEIKNATLHDNSLALVGENIPLKVWDITTTTKVFEADFPDKDWLGLQPETYVSGVDFIGPNRVGTCSKSDTMIRIYDIRAKSKPAIVVDINQEAFNEHAESNRFVTIASSGESGHSVVVGSNVGQLWAIDLRFNVKVNPKKRLQPKASKVLGSFKGQRGGSIKDIKIIEDDSSGSENSYKLVSCCLDRYLRIHNFTRTSRKLDRHIFMKTKPVCCLPVFSEAS